MIQALKFLAIYFQCLPDGPFSVQIVNLNVWSNSLQKRGILERLDAGEVVIGDGGFLYCMERRGYVKAGAWTPEATVEHPEAGQ